MSGRMLRNPVFNGRIANNVRARIVEDTINDRMERDPWYAYNAGRLLLSKRQGLVRYPVFENVMHRLNHIAHQRAAKAQ